MEEIEQKPTLKNKLKNYVIECQRVLRVTRKPSGDEFKAIVKVSSLGIAVIGLIGFLIELIKQYLKLL